MTVIKTPIGLIRMVLKLFTKKGCPRCPAAKELVNQLKLENNLQVEQFDVETVDGMAEAAFYTVLATPTILVCRASGQEITGWRGEVPQLADLIKQLQ